MGHDADMASAQSYPRRNAVTRRFTLGAPRAIVVGADGARVAFLRSSGPEDPVNGLWVFDVDSSAERRVVEPAALGADDADLPPLFVVAVFRVPSLVPPLSVFAELASAVAISHPR